MFVIFLSSQSFAPTFYFRISLYIFFWFFCFKILTQMLVSKSFCPDIFVFFFLSHKSRLQFFVQNVFLKILFPNFYSNFFFFIFNVCNTFGKKYWFKLLFFSFFPQIFLFFTKFCVLIFSLNFCSVTNFDFNFYPKFIRNLFGQKKLIQTFVLSLFYYINLFIICIM